MPKQSWSLSFSKKLIALVGISTLALSTAFAADQPPASLDQLFGIKEAPKPLPVAPAIAPTPESFMPSATLNSVKAEAAPAPIAPPPAAVAKPTIQDPKEDKLWQLLEQAPPRQPAPAAPAAAPIAQQPEPVFAPPPAAPAIANSPRGREGTPMNHRAEGMVSPPSAIPPIDPNPAPAMLEAAPPPAIEETVAPAPAKEVAPVKKAAKPVKPKALVEKRIAPKSVVQAEPIAPKPKPVAKTTKPAKEAKKSVAKKAVAPTAPVSLLPKPVAEKRPDVLAATLAFMPFHSVISEATEAQLKQVAETLKQDATSMVELRGYADWTPNGSLEATDYLAAKRATIVKEYLQTQGIAGNRITVVGKGYDYEGGVPRDRVEVVLR